MPQEGGAITIRVALEKFMTTSSGSKTRGQHVALDEIPIFFYDNLSPKTWCCASQIPAGKIHLCELTKCAITPTMGITNIYLCPAYHLVIFTMKKNLPTTVQQMSTTRIKRIHMR
jgi:hypothetical protein